MTPEQNIYFQKIMAGFYSGQSHADQWREIASHVYANALKNPDISARSIRTEFEPLRRIATSAGFFENAAAIKQAIEAPLKDTLNSVREGTAWSAVAVAMLRNADNPLANVKSFLNGATSMVENIERMAEHATGILSMEERVQLSSIYDLPHEQRIQALHSITLGDTREMVIAGMLPGLLRNAVTKSESAATEASTFISTLEDDISQPNPPLFKNRDALQEAIHTSHGEFDDLLHTLVMGKARKDIIKLLDHMMEVHVTQTADEFGILESRIRALLVPAEQRAQLKTVTEEDVGDPEAGKRTPLAMFERMLPMIQEERAYRFADARIAQQQFEAYQKEIEEIFNNPEKVGYQRSVQPKQLDLADPDDHREFYHHKYWQALHDNMESLQNNLETIGMRERANGVRREVYEMIFAEPGDMVSDFNKRYEAFQSIPERVDAFRPHHEPSLDEIKLQQIKSEIQSAVAFISEDIPGEREYHLKHQLWQSQHLVDQHAREESYYEQARQQLFGSRSPVETHTSASDLER